MKTIAVLTSGGDAPGMNAAIRAVMRKGLYHGLAVMGVERGYEGLCYGDISPLYSKFAEGIISRGGTVLRTARSEYFRTDEGFSAALTTIRKFGIDVLVVVGGDGSMRGAMKLAAAGARTITIPATIDNDMPATEYTIGFDTTINTVLDAINKIRDTAASHERVAVIEVMGRSAGYIALMSGLAGGADAILIPEVKTDIQAICGTLQESFRQGKSYGIVLVAEGVATGSQVAQQIHSLTGFSTPVTVLGYIQRGGHPSAADNIAAARMGSLAIDEILAGRANCLIASQGGRTVAVPYDAVESDGRSPDLSLYELAGVLARYSGPVEPRR